MGELKSQGKPFAISKWEVWEAYRRVKAKLGGPGVDGQTIAEFEGDLQNNLYRIWNRMSSGSYFPPPVMAVEIPKPHGGGTRVLGVPTVADRVAQTVVAMHLEARVDPLFHPDSYGYRQGKSAHQAVETCKRRCWRTDWVIDLDVKAFFDSVRHDLIVKAVRTHTDERWVLLYVQRWLTAAIQQPDGSLLQRDRGTPQGSAVSPVLANLFLHYAFDAWMVREFPDIRFERYADDVVAHCVSQRQARYVLKAITDRLAQVGLQVHPTKTKIVYCKDANRRLDYEHAAFTFLGFTFRPRAARTRNGGLFLSFQPAISKDALNKISAQVRSWRLHRRVNATLAELAAIFNPIVGGWMNYYGAFYRSAIYPVLARINTYLVRWLQHKYRRIQGAKKARRVLRRATKRSPALFRHWQWVASAW